MRRKKQPATGAHGTKRFLHLQQRCVREKCSDNTGIWCGRDDMACREVIQRIQSIVKHQPTVKFRFQFQMRDVKLPYASFNIRMAGRIQGKMTQKAV